MIEARDANRRRINMYQYFELIRYSKKFETIELLCHPNSSNSFAR